MGPVKWIVLIDQRGYLGVGDSSSGRLIFCIDIDYSSQIQVLQGPQNDLLWRIEVDKHRLHSIDCRQQRALAPVDDVSSVHLVAPHLTSDG